MVFQWIRGVLKRQAKAPSKPRSCRKFRPRLEALEDRCVPAAVRNLPGFTTNTLARNDDNSVGPVNVGFNLNFFGVRTNEVFVNNNGNITFNQALSQFTPSDLNSNNGGIPIIAAFFADVDTFNTASAEVQYGTDTLCGLRVFGINYVNVGYFSSHADLLNSFQIILIDRSDTGPGNFDIEFNYDRIQWETGDASGGTNGLGGESARIGYSNGTGVPGTFFELPGSGVNGAFLDTGPMALINNRRLASTPGRYHFLVRNGLVVTVQNGDVTSGTRIFSPHRLVFHRRTRTYRGVITIVNVRPPTQGTNHPCLDITGESVVESDGTFPGPITAVFTGLPRRALLVNRTGRTASGRFYITTHVPRLPQGNPVLRIRIIIRAPTVRPMATFFFGFPIRVFAGQFDRTSA